MKLKLLALLTIILLLASMSCKKKDDDNTSPTAPKTTLAERAGTYDCVFNTSSFEMIIGNDGVVNIALDNYIPQLDINSTATKFTVKSGTLREYVIDFDNNTITGVGTVDNGRVFIMTKK